MEAIRPVERDLEAEAARLLEVIDARGISARLIGGMAIRMLAGPRLHPTFVREIADLDFIVDRGSSRELSRALVEAGYAADEQFNALNGARRMLFWDPEHGRQIDVFVGSFEMCHSLPLTEQLDVRPHTLPAADLLMTKLQIVELNEKDRHDAFAILHAHDLHEADLDPAGVDAINLTRIVSLTSQDWGLQRTFELNLGRLEASAPELPVAPEERAAIEGRINRLAEEIEQAPKSRKWKLR
ncbi:MAG: hypothetical protein ACM3NV_10855, partial [Syntrophothermus sp.]